MAFEYYVLMVVLIYGNLLIFKCLYFMYVAGKAIWAEISMEDDDVIHDNFQFCRICSNILLRRNMLHL
jgi:hypothetical protein